MLLRLPSILLVSFFYLSCTSTPKKVTKPIVQKKPPPAAVTIPKPPVVEDAVDTRYDPACQALPEKLQTLPLFVKRANALISKFVKSCTTKEGVEGILAGSPWTALGFPCTGGKGRVDWKGNRYRPKLAQFQFINSCPMATNDPGALRSLIQTELPVPTNSQLIAYYPFSVVFWEVPEFGDTDVGHVLELYSPAARADGWKAFQANKPLYVRLFGRENSLVKSENLYQVDGYILQETPQTFRFKVENVTPLDQEKAEEIKKRCLLLVPKRDCSALSV
ncbi:MAG: hypothetical protein HRU19_22865 [Pseudobacteriovorax sp.]|nr:hypothetical protein [Pseudobacteriovorax sp.]